MIGGIYKMGRQTRETGKMTVYQGFGNCKGCGYALDDKEIGQELCRTCQET